MERTIKFRGKDIKTCEWVYGYYVHLEDYFRKRESHRIYPGDADSCADGDGYDFTASFVEIDPDTLGQFTGLVDNNGKDIYEGDILRSDQYPFSREECDVDNMEGGTLHLETSKDNYYAEVVWFEDTLQFGYYIHVSAKSDVRGISDGCCEPFEEDDGQIFEVIANIYDEQGLFR